MMLLEVYVVIQLAYIYSAAVYLWLLLSELFIPILALVEFTGDDVPLSPFCMTNVPEWDTFRNIDMDKQVLWPLSFSQACFILLRSCIPVISVL